MITTKSLGATKVFLVLLKHGYETNTQEPCDVVDDSAKLAKPDPSLSVYIIYASPCTI